MFRRMFLALPFVFLFEKIAHAIGYHSHECLVCGAVWTHADGSPMRMHYCPYCQNGPFTMQTNQSAHGPTKIFQPPPKPKPKVPNEPDFKVVGK